MTAMVALSRLDAEPKRPRWLHFAYSRMRGARRALRGLGPAALLVSSVPGQVVASEGPRLKPNDAIAHLVSEDARVAAVAFRLKTVNLPLCAKHGYDIGVVVHTLDQYALPLRPAAADSFGLGSEPGIAAVVPGGPAALAGLRPGDRLNSADGVAFNRAVTHPPSAGTYDTTEKALDLIDRSAADGRVDLVFARDGHAMATTVHAVPACAGRVQLEPSPEMNSWADDRYATITTAMMRYTTSDNDLALIMGHELSHLFLGHEALLNRHSIARRVLGPLGTAPGLILATERDADYLGLYMAARAGFDISGAPGFWRRFAAEHGSATFLLRTHPGGRERVGNAEATVAEIAALERAGRELVPQRKLVGTSADVVASH